MIGYCNVKSFDPGTTNDVLVTNGKCALVSILLHGAMVTTNASVIPLQFKDGSDSGDILYKVRSYAFGGQSLTYQIDLGGDGILFNDGIYFDWAAASGSEEEGVDNVVLFFTGGKAV